MNVRSVAYWVSVGLLALLYLGGAKLGLLVASVPKVTPVWPPTGIALAAVLLFGNRVWPGITLGAILANATPGVPLATACGIGLGNTMEALVGAFLLRSFGGFHTTLDRRQDVWRLVLFGAAVSPLLSATIGVTSLALGKVIPWAVSGSAMLVWWLGNAMGALVVCPVVLTWASLPRPRWSSRQRLEAVALLVALAAVSAFVFGSGFRSINTHWPLAYALFPFVIWAALRFGPRGAATATFVVSGMAIWGTVHHLGPFAGDTVTEGLVMLLAFMSVVAGTALVMAAITLEEARAEEALRHSHDDLEIRVAERTAVAESRARALEHEITERGRVEEALRRTEQMYRQVLDAISDMVLVKGLKSRIVWANKAFRNYYGMTNDQLRDSIDAPFNEPDYTQQYVKDDAAVFTTRKTVDIPQEPVTRHDGEVRLFHTVKSPIFDADGSVIMTVGVSREITERKRTESQLAQAFKDLERKNRELEETRDQALAAARLKAEFLATMSHEIRTPMNGVIGMTNLLLDTEMTEEQREYAETVRTSGEALLTIVNDILDFSKIEAGKLSLEVLTFDPRATVEDMGEMLAEAAQSKGIELACLVAEDVPTNLRGDPGRLRQILINLVGNAIKFTKKGEVVVRAALAEDGPDHVVVRFDVTDTGIGIPPEARARLFQSFSQVDGSTTRKYGGTGLGLAICKQLTELMGGEIGVESKPGQGSTFWFTIRCERQPAPACALPLRADLRGRRVLIVDDNPTACAILRDLLIAQGLTSLCAPDGPEALKMLRAAAAKGRPYDLALLDLQMPGMDGLALADSIRSDHSLDATKLVMLTSFGRRGQAEAARQAGIAGYLAKPVRRTHLYSCVAGVLAPEAEPPSRSFVSPPSMAGAPARACGRVLLAEDNAVNQMVAVRMLEKLGYRADVAANGLEVLEALSRIPYAAVLMDCQMPEMDGFEATASIRNAEREMRTGEVSTSFIPHPAALRRIPIIAMTANAMQGDRERCLAAGMDDYISKPVKLQDLERALERWIPSGEVEPAGSAREAPTPHPPLDSDVLAELRAMAGEDDPEFLPGLLEQFFQDTPALLAEIRKAVERGDAHALERTAHCLKGSCRNLGANPMAHLCAQLEEYGRAGSPHEAMILFKQLENELERVQHALESLRLGDT
jgi:PAS domain S-box-containing protein